MTKFDTIPSSLDVKAAERTTVASGAAGSTEVTVQRPRELRTQQGDLRTTEAVLAPVMKPPLAQQPEMTAPAIPGPLASFLRFVILGGGIGVLCSFAVPLLANTMPWPVSNAIVTVASTLLCTELHARLTFAQGRSAGLREHWQSAGSATAAYLVTSVAVYVLHLVQPSPGMLAEQILYLSASGLAGIGRFTILRLYVFAGRRAKTSRPLMQQGAVAIPAPARERQSSGTGRPNRSSPQLAA